MFFFEAKKTRWRERCRGECILKRNVPKLHRIADGGGHVDMRARQRAFVRYQSSILQADVGAHQVKPGALRADAWHRIRDECDAISSFRAEGRSHRHRIDMQPIEDRKSTR